jgi:hypothetical protein
MPSTLENVALTSAGVTLGAPLDGIDKAQSTHSHLLVSIGKQLLRGYLGAIITVQFHISRTFHGTTDSQ